MVFRDSSLSTVEFTALRLISKGTISSAFFVFNIKSAEALFFIFVKFYKLKVGEMVQWLRALAPLAESLSLVPGTHVG